MECYFLIVHFLLIAQQLQSLHDESHVDLSSDETDFIFFTTE